jgi:hypothetical protein
MSTRIERRKCRKKRMVLMYAAMMTAMVSPNLLGHPGDGHIGDAAATIRRARVALGGDRALNSIRTLRASGRWTRQDPLIARAGTRELVCELPARCVRVDTSRNGGTLETTTIRGFDGDAVVRQLIIGGSSTPPPGVIDTGPAPNVAAQGPAIKLEFARLLLGILASPAGASRLEFTASAPTQIGGRSADAIAVRGTGFFGQWVIDGASHLPVMVSWQAKSPAQPAPKTLTRGAIRPPSQLPQTPDPGPDRAEFRVLFSDYRKVGNVRLPFKIDQSVNGEIVEHLEFDQYRLNQPVDPALFSGRR